MGRSEELFDRARKRIPGGVNSPVRAFGSVSMTPRFIARAAGDRIFDADGKEYIDFVGSWGPMILGHAHPAVLEAVNKAAAEKGWIDEDKIVGEMAVSAFRAGADIYITYYAEKLARMMREGRIG